MFQFRILKMAIVAKYRIYMVLFLLLTSIHSLGQVMIHYAEPLTVEDGLSNNKIHDMLQDDQGFLWIATSYGLNRYDGENIVHFVHDDRKPSIPDNIVQSLMLYGPDHLLIGTGKGIGVMDLNSYTIATIHLADTSAHSGYDDEIEFIRSDALGNIWATTPTMIYRLNKDLKVLNRFRTQKDPLKVRKSNVFNLICLPSGEAFFWLYNGLYYWSPSSNRLQVLSSVDKPQYSYLKQSSFFAVALVNSLYLIRISGDRSLQILNTETGICPELSLDLDNDEHLLKINGAFGDTISLTTSKSGFRFYKITSQDSRPGLQPISEILMSGKLINRVFKDHEGNFWASPITGGLLKMVSQKQLFHSVALSASDQKEYEISRFFRNGKDLLAGTFGSGFFQYDLQSGKLWQHNVITGPYSENMVWNFWQVTDDTLWMGTQEGLIWYALKSNQEGRISTPHPKVMDSFAITTMYEDHYGLVWMGVGFGNGVVAYNKLLHKFKWYPYQAGGYPYRYPLGALEDRDGNMWFISDPTGNLVKWDRVNDEFTKVIVPGIRGELDWTSNGFFMDKTKNQIWLGVRSGRLVCYDIDKKTSVVYGIDDGYTSGAITSIIKDIHGNMWLANTQGISCFVPGKKQFRNFFMSDGLPASYFSSALYYDSTTDRLYAGAPGVFTWFDTEKAMMPAPPLPIIITEVLVNNKKRGNRTKGLSLGPGENNVRILFTGVNLADGKDNQYEYRLNEGDWISLGQQNEINFSSLNPGDYQVSIRGARKDAVFNGPVSTLTFSIHPYFTQTIWFILLCIGAAFALAYAWYRYRLRYIRHVDTMRSRISRDLHDEIGSRVTNIGMMSTIASRDSNVGGKEWLQKIQAESEAVTQNLREIVNNINPENDALAIALPRILRQASGYLEAAGITVRAEIPDMNDCKLDMEKRRDLYLIMKEAVNNIVKHAHAQNADIRIQQTGRNIFVEINDDGKGFDKNEVQHAGGLNNMKSRAARHQWDMQVISNHGAGTRVSLELKVEN